MGQQPLTTVDCQIVKVLESTLVWCIYFRSSYTRKNEAGLFNSMGAR